MEYTTTKKAENARIEDYHLRFRFIIYILIGENIAFLADIVKGAILFLTYIQENIVSDKSFGVQIAPLRQVG